MVEYAPSLTYKIFPYPDVGLVGDELVVFVSLMGGTVSTDILLCRINQRTRKSSDLHIIKVSDF